MRQISQRFVIAIGFFLGCAAIGAAWMLTRESATLAGVPVPLIVQALKDETALNYYISRDKRAFHNRLKQIGIKEEIKAFYRPQIHDEVKLDQYIHQIFYNDTGYVGDAYYVNPQGILVLKNPLVQSDTSFKDAAQYGGTQATGELLTKIREARRDR